ncbi:MAG: large conductance mechanosensitive channel protein MscL [Lactovum sp.]
MLKEFKDFLSERNILDFAVGVIIGGSLTTIIKSFVDNFINPLIGCFLNSSALKKLHFDFSNARFNYGIFLNDLLNFILTAFIVFLIIKFIRKAFSQTQKIEKELQNEELQILTEIRDLLKNQNSF